MFTPLHRSVLDEELHINGYTLERADRGKGHYGGGGVLYYICDDIHYHRRRDLESRGIEAIIIKIFIVKSKSILQCFPFRPPNNSAYSDRNFNVKYHEMLELVVGKNIETILASDLNCNYLVPNDDEIRDGMLINGLKHLIHSPTMTTRKTKTLIDIVTLAGWSTRE